MAELRLPYCVDSTLNDRHHGMLVETGHSCWELEPCQSSIHREEGIILKNTADVV